MRSSITSRILHRIREIRSPVIPQAFMRLSCPAFLFSLILCAVCSISIPTAFAAEVKNDRATMEGNRVVWEYDLEGAANQPAQVTLSVTIAGKTYAGKDLHLEGDIGKVVPGRGKKLWWNVLRDFPRGVSSKVDWELMAVGVTYTDPVKGMELVFVKGGCYQMGDTFGEGGSDEKPVHEVCVSDFYIGKYEVTQGEWEKVMGSNPSKFKKGPRYPVEMVSWRDVQEFMRKLNLQGGRKYRLPTEAEWEYAARSGGKKERFAGTSDILQFGTVAWYSGNSGGSTHPVGEKAPNGLGLYDMNGNVWEWCSDWYEGNYYATSPKADPQGPPDGGYPVLRGGSWFTEGVLLYFRTSFRVSVYPGSRDYTNGFRVVSSPKN